MKRLPVGVDQFRTVIEQDLLFVDKSMLIAEVIEDSAMVILITRPRRFGKSLNLSMLRSFFDNRESGSCFDHLAIMNHKPALKHKNQYPVIHFSLKDIRGHTLEEALGGLYEDLSQLYRTFQDQILPHCSPEREAAYRRILSREAQSGEWVNALKSLSQDLSELVGEPCLILIDEYDAPLHAAFQHGFYNELVEVLRALFSRTLKDNPYLWKAVLTGILRASKESIFSGLNNVHVHSVFSKRYDAYFGFSEQEVKTLIQQSGSECAMHEIQRWYNGYRMGRFLLYNPWSIVSYLSRGEGLQAYWVNTSDNAWIADLVAKSDVLVKQQFEMLLAGHMVSVEVNEFVSFRDWGLSPADLWYVLLGCGYLTYEHWEPTPVPLAQVRIPNQEVMTMFQKAVLSWFSHRAGGQLFDTVLVSLIEGDEAHLQHALQALLNRTVSYFDVQGDEPERVYHALVLGMLIGLSDRYEIRSNRESGMGRYDIMLLPKKNADAGIIIEFKRVLQGPLQEGAQQALKQIQEKGYASELEAHGVAQILTWGMAFQGKRVDVALGKRGCDTEDTTTAINKGR